MDEKKKNKKKFRIIDGGKTKEKTEELPSWKKIQNAFTEGMKESNRTVEDAIQDLGELRKEQDKEKD